VVTVLHLSDTHLTGHTGALVMDVDPDDRMAIVLEAWARSGEHADLIVHTGDVSDDESVAGPARVAAALAPLGAPILAVCGNHDLPSAVRAAFGEAISVEVGAWRVVGLESSMPSEIHGWIDAEVAMDLLDGYDTRPTIVAMHPPPRCRSSNPWFRLEGATELLDALAARPHVRALLSGHLHDACEPAGPGVLQLLNGPSVLAAIAHRGDDMQIGAPGAPTGARILRLADDGTLTHELLVA
jgi:3',5'-cyclic AMP phosphodiesterase CpdA